MSVVLKGCTGGNQLTCSTEDLQDVENAQIDERSFSGVVDLSALDHDSIGGQVDSPGESRSTAQDLEGRSSQPARSEEGKASTRRLTDLGHVVLKHAFSDVAIRTQHTSMMDTVRTVIVSREECSDQTEPNDAPETRSRQIFHLPISASRQISLEARPLVVRFSGRRIEQVDDAFGLRFLSEHLGRLDGVFSGMDEDHALVTSFDEFGDLVAHIWPVGNQRDSREQKGAESLSPCRMRHCRGLFDWRDFPACP